MATTYHVNSQADIAKIPLPLQKDDVIYFYYCGSVYKLPTNLGASKIQIDCIGGDSDMGEYIYFDNGVLRNKSDILPYSRYNTNQYIMNLHGNFSDKRWAGRGGHAGGILNMSDLPEDQEYLYIVVGESGRQKPTSATTWESCTFGGGGFCDAGNPDHVCYEAADWQNIANGNIAIYTGTLKDPALSFSAGGASDVRLYYDINATDYGQLTGEPSNLRQLRHQHCAALDKGTLAIRSLKSRIIVAGGAGAADTPNRGSASKKIIGHYGVGTSGGLADTEGIQFPDWYYGTGITVGFCGFSNYHVPGGQMVQTNESPKGLDYSNMDNSTSITDYGVGILGIGGHGYKPSAVPYTYASGAGGGGFYGGYAADGGGTGGSSFVAGSSYRNTAKAAPTIFPETRGVTLDDSNTIPNTDLAIRTGDNSISRTHCTHQPVDRPLHGIVRIRVISTAPTSSHLRAKRGTEHYSAKIYDEENKKNYVPTDNAGKNFIKIATRGGVDMYARYSTQKSFKGSSYLRKVNIRRVDRGDAGRTAPNAILQVLADIYLRDIPTEITSLQISGSVVANTHGRDGWINIGNNYRYGSGRGQIIYNLYPNEDFAKRGKDWPAWTPDINRARHAMTYMLTTEDNDLGSLVNASDNYRILKTGDYTKKNVPPGFWDEAYGDNPFKDTNIPEKYVKMYAGIGNNNVITYDDIITELDKPVTQTYPDTMRENKDGKIITPLTMNISVTVPRETFNKHILLVRTLGWYQVAGWVESNVIANQTLTISGSVDNIDATPFVYARNNTDYYILPK